MAKTIFEEMGGTYEMQGDYRIPCIALPPEKETKPFGIWGQRHKHYLQQNHRVLYMNLLTSSKLNSYLADIDEQEEKMFSRLVKQMTIIQGLTENLKANDQPEWTGKKNNIRHAATETVNNELIFR